MVAVQLRQPALDLLPDYVSALERGWSADNVRGAAAAAEEISSIARDAAAFVALLDDRDAKGAPITMPDGRTVPRLPGFRLWLWDGEFCGSIGFRWHVLGHIGYAVVQWKQRRSYATQALALLLPAARGEGLGHVDITTDPDNIASQKVILANGGRLVGPFRREPSYGATPRICFIASTSDRGGNPGVRYRGVAAGAGSFGQLRTVARTPRPRGPDVSLTAVLLYTTG
jgi:predicted acetyltransferase